MVKSDRKRASFYIGVVLVTLFAMLCVIPLIYMICVSFAHTSTMYIKFDDIDFTDFSNYIYLFVNQGLRPPAAQQPHSRRRERHRGRPRLLHHGLRL